MDYEEVAENTEPVEYSEHFQVEYFDEDEEIEGVEYLEQNEDTQVTENNSNGLFSFTASLTKKDFVGQKSARVLNHIKLDSDDVGGILNQIWEASSPLISRRVRMNDSKAEWDQKVVPEKCDMDYFIVIRHIKYTKNYVPSALTSSIISKFKEMNDVDILVHRFGNEVSSRALFKAMETQLIKTRELDRANAESTMSTVELVQKLKDAHQTRFRSHFANWTMWAVHIQRQDPILRESLINGDPPRTIDHLFEPIPCTSASRLNAINNQIRFSSNMNNSHKEKIAEMRKFYNEICVMLKSLNDLVGVFGIKLAAMESATETTSKCLNFQKKLLKE